MFIFNLGVWRFSEIFIGALPIFPVSLMVLSVNSHILELFLYVSSVLCPLGIDLMGMGAIL